MLAPKKLKHRKQFRPDVRNKGSATKGTTVAFGSFGLMAMEAGWIKAKQIESARRVMSRFIRRGGRIWIRIFPHSPITAKGSQTTMGGGKGVPEHYVAAIKAGTVLFEMDGIAKKQAQEALESSGYKLPIKTKFITKIS